MRLPYLLALTLPFLVSASLEDQTVFSGSSPAMVKEPSKDELYTPLTSSQPTLSDLLTIESSASIYFSYARETVFSKEFEEEGGQQLTLLVPTNKAVMALGRKPHQGPAPVESGIEITEQQYDEQSQRNVVRWVAAHIIPSRVSLSDVPVTYNTMLDGKSVTFAPASGAGKDSAHWSRVTLENGVRILGMKEGANGVIYIIDGTVHPN
ncbi:hypothetical protein PAXRUDRAFT_199226 [Paxillus rubicundulus Ve08.2h10]|uniref:FAS1 domain-containing protein n=1 Tax=Paxillus rubicundulus Ve08.2h10 TaxID=930991 RepID=A0A0D0DPZ4_9AGAM|nr:hypothetical protein PAXRUDRAFT_199226 [Paxillus rubicundulus Ve08.2h10]